ncbi:hypothetical protein A2U01_0097406, partial [Trifolium medium]|nr:hypothetical protein [Trifolium medium]
MHQFMLVYAPVQVSQGNLAPAQHGYAPAQILSGCFQISYAPVHDFCKSCT